MMIKLITLLTRKDGMSLADFSAYWLDVYGPVFAKTPGVRQYVQSHVIPVREGYEPAYDGMAEAWFDDLEAFIAATQSSEWAAARNHRQAFLAVGTEKMLVASEIPMIDPAFSTADRESMVKYVGMLTRLPDLEVPEWQRHWREEHGRMVMEEFPGMKRYIQSHALPETYGTRFKPDYDGVPLAWFGSVEEIPEGLLGRSGELKDTPAARDSESIFVQPIPTMITREHVIIDEQAGGPGFKRQTRRA